MEKFIHQTLDRHDADLKAKVEAATLRAVGEWLLKHAGHATDKDIEALRNRKMPWKE